MTAFPGTRAAVGHICRHTSSDATRCRAAAVIQWLDRCDTALAGHRDADAMPLAVPGLLRELVLAVRELAGAVWLAVAAGHPDVATFTALGMLPAPPAPAILDRILSRVLWAHCAPGQETGSRPATDDTAPG